MFRLQILLLSVIKILGEEPMLDYPISTNIHNSTCFIQEQSCTFIAQNLPENKEKVKIDDDTKFPVKKSGKAVVKVRFEESLLYSIPKQLFQKFNKIEILDIHNQNIEKIDLGFEHAVSLKRLDLSKNKIKELNATEFEGANNLKEIKLFDNEISIVNKNAFKNLNKLEILYLFNNKIKNLDKITFEHVKKLRILNLGGNELEFLDRKLFSLNFDLTHLHLHQNKFTALSHSMFSHLKKLKKLEFIPNLCINKDYSPNAREKIKLIERDLRDCSLTYLFKENEEVNLNFESKVQQLNKAMIGILKKFNSTEKLILDIQEKLNCSKYERLRNLKLIEN